jgi:hypothetical protein
VIRGSGTVLVGLVFAVFVFASKGPTFFYLGPAVFVLFGLVGGIRGLVRMLRAGS